MDGKFGSRDRVQASTPMRCPVCDRELEQTLVRDIGGVTGTLFWQLHAGRCPEHGWFQTEVITRPPREIFPVNKPFGAARRMIVDGREVFSFPTVWDSLPWEKQRAKVDPLDPRYWQIDRSRREHEIY
jgi:hypothetical protein